MSDPAAALTAEQEIRARALAAAVRFHSSNVIEGVPNDADYDQVILWTAGQFAAWITDGTEP